MSCFQSGNTNNILNKLMFHFLLSNLLCVMFAYPLQSTLTGTLTFLLIPSKESTRQPTRDQGTMVSLILPNFSTKISYLYVNYSSIITEVGDQELRTCP